MFQFLGETVYNWNSDSQPLMWRNNFYTSRIWKNITEEEDGKAVLECILSKNFEHVVINLQ